MVYLIGSVIAKLIAHIMSAVREALRNRRYRTVMMIAVSGRSTVQVRKARLARQGIIAVGGKRSGTIHHCCHTAGVSLNEFGISHNLDDNNYLPT